MSNLDNFTIFDYLYDEYKINKPVRLIELFAGYGSQALALKYLGIKFEHWRICEWAVKSIQAYKDIHFSEDNNDYSQLCTKEQIIDYLYKKGISSNYNEPMQLDQIKRLNEKQLRTIYNNIIATKNLVNISQVKAKDLDICDTENYDYIMTYSFPCFTGDSMVLTSNGYKRIDEIQIGDYVLTHKNKYQKVLNFYNNGIKSIYQIKGLAIDEIKTTKNHKFLVRTRYRKWDNSKRMYLRLFEKPKWKEVEDISKNDYLGIAINQNSIIPIWNGINFEWQDGRKTRHKNELNKYMDNKNFWWIVGRYIGDGWLRNQGGIIICCDKNETDEIEIKLQNLFNYSISQERTVNKIHIPLKELGYFCEQFGKGAKNKRLTNTIIDLPTDLLESFINGYESADCCICKEKHRISSISRELIYGIGQCIAKVYKTPYKIYSYNRDSRCYIEGRECNINKVYEIVYKKEKCKQDKAFYENGYIWYPISSIEYIGEENVYDIEIENDHSFTVQNTIVHNCQDLSLAGLGKGMKKGSSTRSGLLWEVERILDECNEIGKMPQILLMENVPQVIGANNIKDFKKWLAKLESLGYSNYVETLNAKDYLIPQNRERTFMVSILGQYNYNFPKKEKLNLRLKDLLEQNVDEKYYLSSKTIQQISKWNSYQNPLDSVMEKNSICPTITTRIAESQDGGINASMKVLSNELDNTTNILDNIKNNKELSKPELLLLLLLQTGELENKEFPVGCDSSINEPKVREVSNCITSRYDAGIQNQKQIGMCVVEEIKNKRLRETLEQNEIEDGDFIDAYNRSVKKDGVAGTILTGVDFRNHTFIGEIKKVGNYSPSGHNASSIIDTNGIAPTVMENHGTITAIVEKKLKQELCDKLIAENKVQENDVIRHSYSTSRLEEWEKRGTERNNMCPTLDTRCDCLGVVVDDNKSMFTETEKKLFTEDGNIKRYIDSDIVDEFKEGQMATTTFPNGYGHGPRTHDESIALNTIDRPSVKQNVRIRKLTPKECFRLMGVKDEDFEKVQKNQSNASLYHLAGDSIVTTCLMAIFSKLFENLDWKKGFGSMKGE